MPEPKTAEWKPVGATAKLAYIQAHVPKVEKTGRNTHQKFDYMQEHGLLGLLRPFQRDLHVLLSVGCVEGTYEHDGNLTSGTFRATIVDTDLPADAPDRSYSEDFVMQATDTQGWGAAKLLTYGKKFALQKFCGIPTDDLPEAEQEAIASTASGKTRKASNANLSVVANSVKAIRPPEGPDRTAFDNKITAKLNSLGVGAMKDLTNENLEEFRAFVAELAA